jgi:hypothetical protein
MFVACYEFEIILKYDSRVEEVQGTVFERTNRGVASERVWRSFGMRAWSEDNCVCVCVCVCVITVAAK